MISSELGIFFELLLLLRHLAIEKVSDRLSFSSFLFYYDRAERKNRKTYDLEQNFMAGQFWLIEAQRYEYGIPLKEWKFAGWEGGLAPAQDRMPFSVEFTIQPANSHLSKVKLAHLQTA